MSNTVVNTNVLALNSHRSLKNVGTAQSKASARLSSGLRINSAADDAAGLAISEKMRGQIRGLDMAAKNAQDGISMIQTAEGGMQEIDNMVQRIRELIVYASNDTNDSDTKDLAKIQGEISQLIEEIDSMAGRVEFNNKRLLSGTYSAETALWLQVGANGDQKIQFGIQSLKSSNLGTGSMLSTLKGTGVKLASGGVSINALITVANQALQSVTKERAKLGAVQNRLEYTIKSLEISSENLSAAESRIRDTDMAKEMMSFTKANVLQQAATSMLAQANQAPQNVLQLLR